MTDASKVADLLPLVSTLGLPVPPAVHALVGTLKVASETASANGGGSIATAATVATGLSSSQLAAIVTSATAVDNDNMEGKSEGQTDGNGADEEDSVANVGSDAATDVVDTAVVTAAAAVGPLVDALKTSFSQICSSGNSLFANFGDALGPSPVTVTLNVVESGLAQAEAYAWPVNDLRRELEGLKVKQSAEQSGNVPLGTQASGSDVDAATNVVRSMAEVQDRILIPLLELTSKKVEENKVHPDALLECVKVVEACGVPVPAVALSALRTISTAQAAAEERAKGASSNHDADGLGVLNHSISLDEQVLVRMALEQDTQITSIHAKTQATADGSQNAVAWGGRRAPQSELRAVSKAKRILKGMVALGVVSVFAFIPMAIWLRNPVPNDSPYCPPTPCQADVMNVDREGRFPAWIWITSVAVWTGLSAAMTAVLTAMPSARWFLWHRLARFLTLSAVLMLTACFTYCWGYATTSLAVNYPMATNAAPAGSAAHRNISTSKSSIGTNRAAQPYSWTSNDTLEAISLAACYFQFTMLVVFGRCSWLCYRASKAVKCWEELGGHIIA